MEIYRVGLTRQDCDRGYLPVLTGVMPTVMFDPIDRPTQLGMHMEARVVNVMLFVDTKEKVEKRLEHFKEHVALLLGPHAAHAIYVYNFEELVWGLVGFDTTGVWPANRYDLMQGVLADRISKLTAPLPVPSALGGLTVSGSFRLSDTSR